MKPITIKTKNTQRKVHVVFSSLTLSILILLVPHKVEAKSTSWSIPSPVDLATVVIGDYCAAPWCKAPDYDETRLAYVRAGRVMNTSVSILYAGTIQNITKGTSGDAPAIVVGNSIRFYPTPDPGTDISWNGTGTTDDTPYGRWTTDRSVTCNSTTQVFHSTGSGSTEYWGYMNFTVDPKTVTISRSGTATLSCSDAYNCTVTGPGTINVTMTWPATNGYFNYRYTKTGATGDSGDWLPTGSCRSAIVYDGDISYPYLYDTSNVIAPTAYVLPVPAKSISFSLTATAAPSVDVHFSLLDSIKKFFASFITDNFKVFASTR